MNRPGRNTLLLIALLLAVVVAYFSDPVLSDPSRDTETMATATVSPTPTAMSIQTSATTTPPTATTTPAVNSPPTVQVMTFGGFGQARPFPDDEVYKVNISGSRVSIKLRGQDDDGNLAYLAIVDEDDEIRGQSDCDATMRNECTLEVTVPSPAEYDRAFTYYGIAVDSDGASSEKSARIEITSVSDSGSYASMPTPSPTPVPVPVPTPDPMTPLDPMPPPIEMHADVAMSATSGEEAIVEHGSGVMIEIPAGATELVPQDWTAGPELGTSTPATSDEMVTVSITDFETPSPSVVEVQSAYDISVVDENGEDIVLREPVTITLPYTLPDDKTTEDLEVVYWNEPLERWESVEGGIVDETSQTITVDMDHLTGVGVSLFVDPVRLLALVQESIAGADNIGVNYEKGYKHAITLHGDVTVPFKFVGVEVGASLVLDADDILSLGKEEGEGYTVEGRNGYFTFGEYRHFALEPRAEELSLGVTVTMPYTGKYMGQFGPSGYNNDLSFESSFSLVSVSTALGGIDLLTLNSNGNFSPVDAQLGQCADCVASLGFNSGMGAETYGVDVEVLSTSLNVARGEFNTNFENVLQNLMQGQCGQSRCKITWSDFIDLAIKTFRRDFLGVVYSLGEKVGLIYEYTAFENLNPEVVAGLGWGYVNQIKDVTGGQDVNGDGRGDMVFPSDSSEGTPLQVWTTGDGTENQRHFLEVVSITDGWSIEFNATGTPSELNASTDEVPSDDALLRVDFDAPALSLNTTHWLVTATTAASNPGAITFRLKHNVPLGTDQLLDEKVYTLWKDKQFSDLSVRAHVSPDPVRTDEPVTYTVNLDNVGPETADDVKLQMYAASNLGLTLEEASLTDSSLRCEDDIALLGNLVCNLGDLDAGETATATLKFRLKPDFPTGTLITAAFVGTSEVVRGAPLPKEELTPGNNATTTAARTASDRNALVALYNATDGQNWTVNTNWLSEEPIYTWSGVRADDRGRVTELNLAGLGLDGEIPAEIGDLTKVRWLNLARNSALTGELPAEMAQLTELEVLYVGENDHTGSVPSWLGDLAKLSQLGLGHNRLTGTIPAELRNLTELTVLHLGGNDLTGAIPAWLSELTKLQRLLLNDNDLAGTVPSALAGLAGLEYLYLDGNSFTGCLPAGLGDVTKNDVNQLGLVTCGIEASVPFARDPAKDIYVITREIQPSAIWSDGSTMWVAEETGGIYPYELPDGVPHLGRDFSALIESGNEHPFGLWSDGTTMWVLDGGDDRIYAYDMSTMARDAEKDFETSTLRNAGHDSPSGIWSDGTTMWVADFRVRKIFAYDMSTREWDTAKDFATSTVEASGNYSPTGIWSNGRTMWVADRFVGKIFAYDMSTMGRDADKDFATATLDAAGITDPISIWSDGVTMWVAGLSSSKLRAFELETTEPDPTKDIDLFRPEEDGRLGVLDLWSDGTTMWAAYYDGNALGYADIWAHDLSTRHRNEERDITGVLPTTGIWSDGATMWLLDTGFREIDAYSLATLARDTEKDFGETTLEEAGHDYPRGLWSDGTTMWVGDSTNRIFAYNLATKTRDESKDFATTTLETAGNAAQFGIWSDGTTMWVLDEDDQKIYAYSMATKQREVTRDFDTLAAAGQRFPRGIWSDGTTMWVGNGPGEIIYAYHMPP